MNAKDQIQVSSVYDVEESCTEVNLRVENLAMDLSSGRGEVLASKCSAREMVELK